MRKPREAWLGQESENSQLLWGVFGSLDCTIVSDAAGYLGGQFGGQLGRSYGSGKTTTCPSSSIALALRGWSAGSRFAGKSPPACLTASRKTGGRRADSLAKKYDMVRKRGTWQYWKRNISTRCHLYNHLISLVCARDIGNTTSNFFCDFHRCPGLFPIKNAVR